MKIYRQGDVLLKRIDGEVPGDAKPIERDQGRIVLAYGEVTGHAHAIKTKRVSFWQTPAGLRYLKAEVKALLKHAEHSKVELPAGVYEVIRQREYSPEELRTVAD